jgi:hypothetical protein
VSAADTLRRAVELVEQAATEATAKGYEYAGIGKRGDEWAALLTVPVAGPLAAWLRVAAADAEQRAAAGIDPQDSALIDGALAFAHAVLRGAAVILDPVHSGYTRDGP